MSRARAVLSVVIPCRNAASVLAHQLRALSTQEWNQPWEVVVVDNGSDDATSDVAESFRPLLPSLMVLEEPRRGRQHACNLGARAASGDAIVFVDADDEVAPAFVQAMARGLEKAPLVAGRLDHTRFGPNGDAGFGVVQTDSLSGGFGFLPFADGCAMGIRRGVFEELGGFARDMDFCEDVDISWRAQLAGFAIRFLPEARVFVRQRTNLRGMLRQHRRFGVARVRLYAHFRHLGMPRRSGREVARGWWSLIRSFPRLRTYDQRARWVRRFGRSVGFLEGSLRLRVLYA